MNALPRLLNANHIPILALPRELGGSGLWSSSGPFFFTLLFLSFSYFSSLLFPFWFTESGSLETVTTNEAHGGLLNLVQQWLHGSMHGGVDVGDQPASAELLRSRCLLVLRACDSPGQELDVKGL